jgi:hypothetical protein
MSISNDVTSQLEKFSELQAFFDAIKNPEKTTKLLEDAKALRADLLKYIGPYDTVEKANAFLVEAKTKVSDASVEVNKMYDDLDKDKAIWAKQVKDRQDKQDQKDALLVDSADALTKKEVESAKREAAVKVREDTTFVKEQTLAARASNQELLQRTLDEKSAKLKAIIG